MAQQVKLRSPSAVPETLGKRTSPRACPLASLKPLERGLVCIYMYTHTHTYIYVTIKSQSSASVLGFEPLVSPMLGQCFTTELYASPFPITIE